MHVDEYIDEYIDEYFPKYDGGSTRITLYNFYGHLSVVFVVHLGVVVYLKLIFVFNTYW